MRFRGAVPRHVYGAAPPCAPRGWVAISPPRQTTAYGFLSFTSRRTSPQFPYGQKAAALIFAEQEHTRQSQAHAAFGKESLSAKEARNQLFAERHPRARISAGRTRWRRVTEATRYCSPKAPSARDGAAARRAPDAPTLTPFGSSPAIRFPKAQADDADASKRRG